jgi:hypothetical protein
VEATKSIKGDEKCGHLLRDADDLQEWLKSLRLRPTQTLAVADVKNYSRVGTVKN